MENLNQPLSDEELDWLDEFLLNRFDEDDYVDGMDEGIFDVSTLDGYLTAIVSGPEMVPPSIWVPRLDGDREAAWESEQQFQQVFSLLVRQMNSISAWLMSDLEDYEPLFMERKVDGKTYTIVDEWCEGYMRGIRLNKHLWNLDSEEMKVLLAPIVIFGSERGDRIMDQASEQEADHLRNQVAPSMRRIHRYWLERRVPSADSRQPFRHAKTAPGRNDPCPCGSGKKYKKCCLH